MGRSRADEILREWSAVSNTAIRPEVSPKRRRLTVNLSFGLAAAGIAAVLAVVFLGPQLINRSQIAAVTPSPSGSSAAVVPTASATSSPSQTTASLPPSTPPATSPVTPTVLASVAGCASDVDAKVVADAGLIWFACNDAPTTRALIAVDPATNKTVRKISVPFVDRWTVTHGVVYASTPGGEAMTQTGSNVMTPTLYRYEASTGKKLGETKDRAFLAEAADVVWIGRMVPSPIYSKADSIDAVDPATGNVRSTIAWGRKDFLGAGCGSLFGSATTADGTTISKIDPAGGQTLATWPLPANSTPAGEVGEMGNRCWVDVQTVDGSNVTNSIYDLSNGGSGNPKPVAVGGSVAWIDGAFWTRLQDGAFATVDPATGSTTGTQFAVPFGQNDAPAASDLIGAGGTLWHWDAASKMLQRLDIPAK